MGDTNFLDENAFIMIDCPRVLGSRLYSVYFPERDILFA